MFKRDSIFPRRKNTDSHKKAPDITKRLWEEDLYKTNKFSSSQHIDKQSKIEQKNLNNQLKEKLKQADFQLRSTDHLTMKPLGMEKFWRAYQYDSHRLLLKTKEQLTENTDGLRKKLIKRGDKIVKLHGKQLDRQSKIRENELNIKNKKDTITNLDPPDQASKKELKKEISKLRQENIKLKGKKEVTYRWLQLYRITKYNPLENNINSKNKLINTILDRIDGDIQHNKLRTKTPLTASEILKSRKDLLAVLDEAKNWPNSQKDITNLTLEDSRKLAETLRDPERQSTNLLGRPNLSQEISTKDIEDAMRLAETWSKQWEDANRTKQQLILKQQILIKKAEILGDMYKHFYSQYENLKKLHSGTTNTNTKIEDIKDYLNVVHQEHTNYSKLYKDLDDDIIKIDSQLDLLTGGEDHQHIYNAINEVRQRLDNDKTNNKIRIKVRESIEAEEAEVSKDNKTFSLRTWSTKACVKIPLTV